MAGNTAVLVKDVNRQMFTEPSGQLKCPRNILFSGKMSISVDQEMDYAELVLSVGEITLGEKNRKLMKDAQPRRREAQNISQAVCTLLNSGGGVVKAHIKNSNYSFTRDGIGMDLEKSFGDILPFPHKYLNYMQKKDYFLIFVKPWIGNIFGQHVLTLKTNFYVRSFSFSVELKMPDAVKFLKIMKNSELKSCLRQSLPGKLDSDEILATFFNKEELTYKETFCFTKSKLAEVKMSPKEKIIEILPKIVSAFANTDGGYLFIGLDGEKQQIIGFEAEKSDLDHLKSEIQKCIQQLPVTHFCEEQEKIKYTCKFIQVHRPGAVCSYVCALRVERFCCAVFAAGPDSWHVEDGCVKRFTTEEWVKLQMDTPPVVSKKVTCSPEALFMEFFSEHERYGKLLHTEVGSLRQGTLVISKSWALGIDLPEKQEVILDVLHISQDSLLTLHSFVRGDEEIEGDSAVLTDLGAKLKNYCKQTALTLKQMLVNLGGYTGNIGFAIKITYLGHRAVSLYDSSSIISYPRNYYLTTKTARDLVKALAQDLGAAYQGKTVLISLPLKF
ncbi:schlafen family member 2-like [Peromyscus eremicus]|uniref:schlafen family member 2-like n=1 Tax=Peromyscus eremicus TaxID=42410 RepID=UPI0027DD91AA|nr:schlafen family member 2-like [Peromyscus eremicus]